MYLILSDATGKRYECMVIAGDVDRMRVAFCGGEDAVELTRRQNHWISDDCGPVEVESIVAADWPLTALEAPAQYLMAG
jgi:hypothetical protein